jgi:pullulanase
MYLRARSMAAVALLALSVVLTSCGGGGGGGGSSPPPPPVATAVPFADASALWLNQTTIAWPNVASGRTYKLLSAANAGLSIKSDGTITGADSNVDLGAPAALPSALAARYPQLSGNIALTVPSTVVANLPALLKTQLVIVELAGSQVTRATHLQLQGVIDDTYAIAAESQSLGVSFAVDETPTFRLWAPTARSVSVTVAGNSAPMTQDAASGVWSYTGTSAMTNTAYYTYTVEVYSRTDGASIKTYTVTDPYAVSLDAMGTGTPAQRAMVVDLASAASQPSGWTSAPAAPSLAKQTDAVLYELHIRDFSDNDPTVPTAHQGKYLAFTDTTSAGMTHLGDLARAGVTHVHLLPAFDTGSVPDTGCTTPSITNTDPISQTPQSAVTATASTDCYNWGYDPRHFGAPNGPFSSDSTNGLARVLEFRQMVAALHTAGLGVVMDVVYNHMYSNYLDRIVPGYYYRLDPTGNITTTSCCSDTATEYAMVEKLMIDTLVRWTTQYQVDGYRFDVMQNIPLAAMLDVKAALAAAAPGRLIVLYGEGFLNSENFVQANQAHLGGSHIGAFNDRIRDAVRGGGCCDNGTTLVSAQGFADGLCYDANSAAGGTCTSALQSYLNGAQNLIRASMAAALTTYAPNANITYNGSPAAFAQNPDETVNYVGSHDGQTLWDISQYKHPSGTASADRARAQVVALSTVLLGQGVPFFMAGDEILRSKAFSQNTYNSGDWFNRIDWSLSTNYIGTMGLPIQSVDGGNWATMTPFLQNANVNPTASDIQAAYAAVRDLLSLRRSTTMFHLPTAADISNCVTFPDASAQVNGLVVMQIGGNGASCGDNAFRTIVVLINANKVAQTYAIAALANHAVSLHPVQLAGSDATVRLSTFTAATGTFTVPARTTAVFVEP